jgi:hypothetical protein
MNLTDSLPSTDRNGKKLLKSYVNAVIAMQNLGVTLPTNAETRGNRFTGVTHELTPIQLAIFDFVMATALNYEATYRLSYNGQKVNQSTFDNARYLFMTLWPTKYYDLLD